MWNLSAVSSRIPRFWINTRHFIQTSDASRAADTWLETRVAESARVTSYIFSGGGRENMNSGSNKEPSLWLADRTFKMFTTKQELERQVRDFIFNISFLQFL